MLVTSSSDSTVLDTENGDIYIRRTVNVQMGAISLHDVYWNIFLATVPQPLSVRFLHRARYSTSSLKFKYLLFSLVIQ